MALFKIKKGLKANLPKTYNEGYCYFTTDDGKMYIDTTNASSGRVCLNAAKADALTVANKGSATNPVYFVGGIPTECGFTVQSNVPANAKFTDTTYSAATSSTAGLMSAADKAKLDGIATGATANTGDITGVTAGKGLTGGGTSGRVTLNVGAGAGLTVADDSIGHTNNVTAKTTYNQATATPGYGGKFKITEPKYDAQGHITGVQVAEITMPSAQTLNDLGITATATELNYTDGVTSNIQTQLDAITTELDAIDWFKKGTAIPNDSDLDTYNTPGKYYINSGSGAETLINCPVTNDNFVLFVFARTSSNSTSLSQMIITLGSNIYLRNTNSSGEWRDWYKMAKHIEATTSAAGLMSATDKSKLDGIATGANKTTVDSSMSSSSTNPVQNKVIKSYVDNQVSASMNGYLPLTGGQNYKMVGPLGFTEGVNYGTTLPSTGFNGQLFFLEDDSPALPTGGTKGQVLIKNSATDGDASWITQGLALTGDVSGSGLFNSEGNLVITTTVADDSHNHTYLPVSGREPIQNFSDDTIQNWSSKNNNSTWWYGTDGCLADQPSTYGFIQNFVYGSDINQIWFTQSGGKVMRRSGNVSGWHGTWRQFWLQGDSVTGAVWNDYAECRESDCEDFGYVLMENGDDTLSKTTERLSHFAGISSDTWGFSQGETDKAKTPIAVAGRVLAYPYQDRNNYKPGDCVCAAPGGTVDIMTREEVINWPDRIVGTVSCVPDYEEWGGGENADRPSVKVNNRIWIKVK